MYAQINCEGNQYQLLSKITVHMSNYSAIQIADGFTTSRNGNRVPKTTIIRLDASEGSERFLADSNLEYAMANKIANEPAFNWWINTALQKQNCIVA
jgi:hypothetical protein